MILPIIFLLLLVGVASFLAGLHPHDNYEAYFFGKVVAMLLVPFIILCTIAILIQFLTNNI
jgi:hypothetical protein